MTMIDGSVVQNLLSSWWFDYDEGNFAAWPEYFTADAHFSCRTDTGTTDYEEFVRADVHGHDAVLAWQTDHRQNSPYPLRHHGTNIHVTKTSDTEAEFRSYIFVTQIANGAVSNLSTALVVGRVRREDGKLRIADFNVVLDTADSQVFSGVVR